MKKHLSKIFIIILAGIILLASCSSAPEPAPEPKVTYAATPTASPQISQVSETSIAFVFMQSQSSTYMPLYHQLAYVKMETQGYNISNVYVDETTDLQNTFMQLETDGVKYAIITSDKLNEQITAYQQNHNSQLAFIQFGDFDGSLTFSYNIKLYEYYYLAGVALASVSETNTAGFIAQHPDEQTIRCINAFALGMKSIDIDSVVMVSWTDDATDQNHINELAQNLYLQNCDVYSHHTDNDLAEKSFSDSGLYYMSASTHILLNENDKLLVKPVIDLDRYYANIVNGNKTPGTDEFEFLGIRQNIISYELSGSISSATADNVLSAYQNIVSGYEVFSGPIYNELGLIVPEGITLPQQDILDMLWFVENVVGELPAG